MPPRSSLPAQQHYIWYCLALRPALQYDAFLATHGAARGPHRSLQDYHRRRALFQANLRMIEAHTAANSSSFKLAMNRWVLRQAAPRGKVSGQAGRQAGTPVLLPFPCIIVAAGCPALALSLSFTDLATSPGMSSSP